MERLPVTSSNIAEIGHDPATNTLEVQFKNGGVYHYFDVPAEKYEALRGADSIGQHLNAHIKPHHTFRRAEG